MLGRQGNTSSHTRRSRVQNPPTRNHPHGPARQPSRSCSRDPQEQTGTRPPAAAAHHLQEPPTTHPDTSPGAPQPLGTAFAPGPRPSITRRTRRLRTVLPCAAERMAASSRALATVPCGEGEEGAVLLISSGQENEPRFQLAISPKI
ncbi:hypothetical protein MFRU_007g00800 [Monilinia fructicola]|nr:hypothetical protein MFRU_007g00800 [Monilinia fructicola]